MHRTELEYCRALAIDGPNLAGGAEIKANERSVEGRGEEASGEVIRRPGCSQRVAMPFVFWVTNQRPSEEKANAPKTFVMAAGGGGGATSQKRTVPS